MYKSPKPILTQLLESIPKIPNENHTSGFRYLSAGDHKIPDYFKVKFQYQYVYRRGTLPLLDFIKNRETGRVFIGVSFSDITAYDGQHGDATVFARHDRRHAYVQKYFDQLLFDEFGAKTHAARVKLKAVTNLLLQARIYQYQVHPLIKLRSAIEVVYFDVLHDQSQTYPVGLAAALNTKQKFTRFLKSISQAAKAGAFGSEHMQMSEMELRAAMNWVKDRADIDEATLRSAYAKSRGEE